MWNYKMCDSKINTWNQKMLNIILNVILYVEMNQSYDSVVYKQIVPSLLTELKNTVNPCFPFFLVSHIVRSLPFSCPF